MPIRHLIYKWLVFRGNKSKPVAQDSGPSKSHWLTPISGFQDDNTLCLNQGFKLRETFLVFDKAHTFAYPHPPAGKKQHHQPERSL